MSDPGDETKVTSISVGSGLTADQTVNEQRAERGLAPLPSGDEITVDEFRAGIRNLVLGDGLFKRYDAPQPALPGVWTLRIDRAALDTLLTTGRFEYSAAGMKHAVELRDGPVDNLMNRELVEAVRAVYYAAWWSPDRQCEASALWEGLRDAAGFAPGEATKALGKILPRPLWPAAGKRIEDLDDAELVAEWKMWDDKIRNATGWGGGIPAADEFRRQCAREADKRGITIAEAGA